MTDKWYTVSEVASMLGVSTETVRRRIKAGEYESKIEGNKYLVKLTDASNLTPQIAGICATDVPQMEYEFKLLRERNQMLENRVQELEEDKGFLLSQINEKDRLMNELVLRALPKPKATVGERLKRLFKRSRSDTKVA
jgi:excisionase family DNA binding protein